MRSSIIDIIDYEELTLTYRKYPNYFKNVNFNSNSIF